MVMLLLVAFVNSVLAFEAAALSRAPFDLASKSCVELLKWQRPPPVLPKQARGRCVLAADFSSAASALFANVRLPASILAGALVPLGFGFALPVEGPALSADVRRSLIRLHRIVLS